MATFTINQLSELMDSISHSGLTSKQLGKKMIKVKKLLSKKTPDFVKILANFSSPQKNNKPKRPKNTWQLFLSEFREELKKNGSNISGAQQVQGASVKWGQMSDEEKEPFNVQALKLSAEYREKVNSLKEINENNEDSSDDISDSKSEAPDTEQSCDDEDDKHVNQDENKFKKKNTEIDTDFWGNTEELDWTRYESGENYWEFVIKECCYITRENNGEKIKILPREMKSDKAVAKSIANQIEKKENDGFVCISK